MSGMKLGANLISCEQPHRAVNVIWKPSSFRKLRVQSTMVARMLQMCASVLWFGNKEPKLMLWAGSVFLRRPVR